MSNADDLKGRVKEAAGDLTDDEELEREGKMDRLAGRAKELADDAKAKADEVVDSLRERLDRD